MNYKDKHPGYDLIVASIGGGIQSTTMACLLDSGVIGPMPDIGLYADTGWDTPNVEETIHWLQRTVKNFPIEIVSCGPLSQR